MDELIVKSQTGPEPKIIVSLVLDETFHMNLDTSLLLHGFEECSKPMMQG